MKFKKCFSQIVHVFLGAMLTVSANAQSASSQKYDFNYRVSDERISVFDDGKVTRIQLPEGMTIPIVMSQEPAGDVLLDLKKDSPYLSIQGTYSKLVMRWSGKREIVASYNGPIEIERQGRPAAFGMATPARTYGAVSEPVEFEKTQMAVQTTEKAPGLSTVEKQRAESSVQAVAANSPIDVPAIEPQGAKFEVSPLDQNFRKVLMKWSKDSGWTFEPEHWAVARDIPVSGSDAVISDYKTAVRRLLKSTTLTDLPVQPCFYSNNVLRVIPASELCARSEN
ncbi:TcpQ domain-containing protein [Limnohabitans sp.]|uniref:TcpQ domain-containing protein n=1 Tax=Limnohabitans sp. TaxID=1907725 RepID=UPI00286F50C7|nr:TcpQ domain-containing protein [Limnohabitans sp.]